MFNILRKHQHILHIVYIFNTWLHTKFQNGNIFTDYISFLAIIISHFNPSKLIKTILYMKKMYVYMQTHIYRYVKIKLSSLDKNIFCFIKFLRIRSLGATSLGSSSSWSLMRWQESWWSGLQAPVSDWLETVWSPSSLTWLLVRESTFFAMRSSP
jgi:hypothetical protein